MNPPRTQRRLSSGPGLQRDTGAVTTLEFALVVPVLLVLMLGIMDYGWILWTVEAVQQGATFGARCMGVLGSACTTGGAVNTVTASRYIQTVVASRGVTVATSTITLNTSTSCGTATGFSKVSVSYTVRHIVPNLLDAFGSGVPLNVTACFPNQPS